MSNDDFYSSPNRYVCSVLEEIRTCYKTRNFAPLLGLVAEAQTMVNRMEASINDKSDVKHWEVKRAELKAEVKELIKQKKDLEKGDSAPLCSCKPTTEETT
tara:strand:+ start:1139 stop:1441 length:303 start_codon:yes stop_codon:yes gene_type:complete